MDDFFYMAPPAGLEPATSWLTVMRSTNWAKEDYLPRRLPTLPRACARSTKGVKELNYCVRNGNRCGLFAITTGKLFVIFIKFSENCIECKFNFSNQHKDGLRSSPRPISTNQLKTLLPLHIWPINQLFSLGSYQITLREILSWGGLRA